MRLIDADDLLEQRVYTVAKGKGFPYREAYKNMLYDIEHAPTVEAEPIRHGHWKIIDQDVMGCKKYRCELCGAVTEAYSLDNIRYCGGCGAKMDEEESHKDCCDYLDENCNCRLEDGQCNYQPLCDAGDCSMCVK